MKTQFRGQKRVRPYIPALVGPYDPLYFIKLTKLTAALVIFLKSVYLNITPGSTLKEYEKSIFVSMINTFGLWDFYNKAWI